jgi:DNA-binding PadR family transcriptional regulator
MICDKKEYVVIKPPNIRGKFKILLLYYLNKQPMHGYALIKNITKDFGMNYIPSPGIIYPALQELEKEGYVKKDATGRRVEVPPPVRITIKALVPAVLAALLGI